ncbi:sugar transferase [Chloroherpeton thalassium ATCC 35110]|uniref:Sugar transferase n=1 Tax=Chloroherpeton thalassium (strain ATCC 35110 / GB-78) TaxID=517418 RepID=B3QVI1_CHLT3|nr:sugar transferase [Chloroherpeton thalassium]ACF14581.1 sugar transferase [Chloroherpeton thalassium ATCC 35110]
MYKFVEKHTAGGVNNTNYITVRDKIINEEQYVLQEHEKHQPIIEFYFHELVRRQTKRNRIFDIVISMLGLIFLVVLFPIIAIGIKLSTSESVILRRKCIGYRGTEFLQYKFRTARNEEDDDNPNQLNAHHGNNKQDVFPFGQFLKKVGFDKLPQLINVLKGEMNLVGPYAYSDGWTNYFNSIFRDFYKRYSMRPGITGLAQAKKHNVDNKDITTMRDLLACDIEYMKMKKKMGDIILFLKSIGAFF